MRLSSMPRAILIAIGHLVSRSILPGSFLRSTLTAPPSTPSAQRERALEVGRGGEDRVHDAESNACWGFSIRFCFSGFEITTSRAFSMPMRFGSR